jgi:hypothetical protein
MWTIRVFRSITIWQQTVCGHTLILLPLLLDNITLPLLVNKLSSFYGIQRFMTFFTTVPVLSHVTPVHIPFYFLTTHFILPCHLQFGIPSGLLPTGFPIKILYEFFSSFTCATHLTQLIMPVTYDKYTFHCATFSPICHFLPHRPIHLPQCHILEYYHMFCILYDRPSFTPTQTTHKITVLYISKFISLDGRWGHKRFWTDGCGALLEFNIIQFFSMSVISVGLACQD